MASKKTKKEYVAGFRQHLIDTQPDIYLQEGLKDSTDDYLAYEILQMTDADFAPEPSASTDGQVVDNIEVTKQNNNATNIVNDGASTDAGQGSTIDNSSTKPVVLQNTSSIRFAEHLNPAIESDSLLLDSLSKQIKQKNVKLPDGSVVDTTTGDKYIQDNNDYIKSHKLSDKEYDDVQDQVKKGEASTTSDLDDYDFSTQIDTSDAKTNRKALVDANEELVETKVDSLIMDGETPMKVTLAKTAARRFESAYDELSEQGINLMIASHKVGHHSQMAQHQKYLKAVEEGKNHPFVSHPDDSFHTIGYAVDLAQPLQYGMYQNIDKISEVMKRHGWNQHKDEWWHFSVDHLDEKFKKKKEVKTEGEIPLSQDGMKIVLDTPVNKNESMLWESYDGKIKLFQEGTSFNELADINREHNSDFIANKILSWGIPKNGEIKQEQFKSIVLNDISPEALEKARKEFFHQYRFDEKQFSDFPNENMTQEEFDMRLSNWKTEIDISRRGILGISFERVLAQAFENSLTGHLMIPAGGMYVEGMQGSRLGMAGKRDREGVELGVIPPMNTAEKALTSALQFIMPLDYLGMKYGFAPAGAWMYKTAVNTHLGTFLRNFVVKNGIATANKAPKLVNKVMHHVLQKNVGTGVARTSQMFGLYDGSLAALNNLFGDGVQVPRRDRNDKLVMKPIYNDNNQEIGQEQVYDKRGLAHDIWSAWLHGTKTGVIMYGVGHNLGKPMKDAVEGIAKNANLPALALKSSGTVAQFIPEYLTFTGLGYSDAVNAEKESLKLFYEQNNIVKTDAEIELEIDKKAILGEVAADTFAFLVAIKALHQPFEATKYFIDPVKQQKLYTDYAVKLNRKLDKNPNNIVEVAMEMAKEMGISGDIKISKLVQARLTNVPVDKQGNKIWDKSAYPEKEVRQIAKELGIKTKGMSYEQIAEKVYEANAKIIADGIDGKWRNEEIQEVVERTNKTELEKENYKTQLEKKFNDKNKEPAEIAKEVVQISLEFGATPLETSNIVKKNLRDNSKDIQKEVEKVADANYKESNPPSLKVKKKKKPPKKKSDPKPESEVKAKTRKEKKRANQISEEVDKKLLEIDGKLASANQAKEEINVKGNNKKAGFTKPHGAKDIVFHEVNEKGETVEVPVPKYKGKKTFKSEEEYQKWVSEMPIRPHMTPTIIRTKSSKGIITAQAWEKLTPKSKIPKQPKVTKIKERQRAELDRDAMSARKLREDIKNDPVLLLRDPNKKPMETMEKVHLIIEQIQEMEGSRSVLAQNLTNLLGDRLVTVGKTNIIKPKDSNEILAVRNSISALDSRMTKDRRQINRLLSNKALNDNIRRKMSVIAKNQINLKATAEGFIDWSGRNRPEKINKEHIDLLKEDLVLDMAEYLSRVMNLTEKPLNKLSATEISKVLSDNYGLPKKTTFEFFKHNKDQMFDLVEKHKFQLMNDAFENVEIDPEYKPEVDAPTPKTPYKLMDKVFPSIGEIVKKNLLDTLDYIKQHEGQIPPNVLEKRTTNQKQVKETEKNLPEIAQLWIEWNNYIAGVRTGEPKMFTPDVINKLPELAHYAQAITMLQMSKIYDMKSGTQDWNTQVAVAGQHIKATKAFFSKIGETLQVAQSKEYVDQKLIQKILNNWKITYDPHTAEYMMGELGMRDSGPKEIKGGAGVDLITKAGAKVTSIGLEVFRANLLASASSSVKAIIGNSFSIGSETMIDGMYWLTNKFSQKRHLARMNKIMNKKSDMPKDEFWNEYIKEQNKFFASGEMSLAWANNQHGRVKFGRTWRDLWHETYSIMTETGDFLQFNPAYGKDIHSHFGIASNTGYWIDVPINLAGKAVRAPVNLMGAFDNAFKAPVYIRELHKLAYHEAISEWSRRYGQVSKKPGKPTRKPEIGNPEHARQMDNIVREILDGGPTGPLNMLWNRSHITAKSIADKAVFQAPFQSRLGKALQQVRATSKDNYGAILGGNIAQFIVPFVVTGVNGIKMAHEYSPTSLMTASFWSDVWYRYGDQSKGWSHRPLSPIYQQLKTMHGAHHRPLVRRMFRKRMAKFIGGTASAMMVADKFFNQDEQDQKTKYLTDNYYGIGKGMFQASQQEERKLRESLGLQSDALILEENKKTFTLNSADPLSTIMQLQDANMSLWNASKNGVLNILKESGHADLAEKAKVAIDARNNPDSDVEFNDAFTEFYLAYIQSWESSPSMALIDKALEVYSRQDGDKVFDVMMGRIAGSTVAINPTIYRQMLAVQEGIRYKPNSTQSYDENGLRYITLKDMTSGMFGNPLQDFMEGKPTFAGNDFETLSKAKDLMPLSEMTREPMEELKERIKYPYSLIPSNIMKMKYSDKYPVLTIFGDPVPVGGPERIWGYGITQAMTDPRSKALGEEFLYLKDNDAKMPTMIPEFRIEVDLFEKNKFDNWAGVNSISKYSGSIKLDEKMQFERMKLIGDLFKDKMWEIVGMPDSQNPLAKSYRSHRKEMDNIREKQNLVPKDSKEWIQYNTEYTQYLNDLTGVWKNVANFVKDAVDMAVYGEEAHNIAFWKDHTRQWLDNPEMLKMELKGYYPNATPEKIDRMFHSYHEIVHDEAYKGETRNILHNEMYRKWRKANNIDTDHINDPDNIRMLLDNLEWGQSGFFDKSQIDTKDGMKDYGERYLDPEDKQVKRNKPPKEFAFEKTQDKILQQDFYLDSNNSETFTKLNNYLDTFKE